MAVCMHSEFYMYVSFPVKLISTFLLFLLFTRIEIPFKFHMMHSGLVHGLAFWFDVAFMGSV